jgi:hypothetical protein
MIAFIREPEEPPELPMARRLHRFLESILFAADSVGSDDAASIPAWRCRLFIFWLIAAAIWCVIDAVRGMS